MSFCCLFKHTQSNRMKTWQKSTKRVESPVGPLYNIYAVCVYRVEQLANDHYNCLHNKKKETCLLHVNLNGL